jgi:D-alanine-D-alanine ligase
MSTDRFGKVAVLMGGLSGEREVSLKSGEAVLKALRRKRVDAYPLDADRAVIQKLTTEKFECAFIALHGRWGEDGVIQGALEVLGLPYTGSGVLASALGIDKLRCKQLWAGAGILTPEYVEMETETSLAEVADWLSFPVFVKPNHEGSSLGMTKATSVNELAGAWKQARKYDSSVFAERCIEGPEYTVTILNDRILPTIRVETPREFYDYQAKYVENNTRYLCPCGLDKESEHKLQEISRRAFDTVGCHGWARVDFMVSTRGTPYVLEINTVPGLTDHSLVPMAAKHAGMSFDELAYQILESSDVTR